MTKANVRISSFVFTVLIALSPFIEAANDAERAEFLNINLLPPVISEFAGYLRWLLFGYALFVSIFNFKRLWPVVDKRFFLITLFYFIQLCYAIATNTDQYRYLALTIFSFTLPFYTVMVFRHDEKRIFSIIEYTTYISIFLSIILNIGMIGSGLRFQGFSNNSNLYGITAVFWLVLTLLFKRNTNWKLLNMVFTSTLLLTVLLSGSRNALVGAIIVIVFEFKNNLKSLVKPALLFLLVSICLTSIMDLHIITDRLMNFENAMKDSGREGIWQSVYSYIDNNLLWGNGMDAHMTLGKTGNMHNCYVRYLLDMGLFFTLLSFFFYIRYLFSLLFRDIANIPGCLIGFIFALTFWNIGEDFFVGIGSSIFIFFMMIVGLITFYSPPYVSKPGPYAINI